MSGGPSSLQDTQVVSSDEGNDCHVTLTSECVPLQPIGVEHHQFNESKMAAGVSSRPLPKRVNVLVNRNGHKKNLGAISKQRSLNAESYEMVDKGLLSVERKLPQRQCSFEDHGREDPRERMENDRESGARCIKQPHFNAIPCQVIVHANSDSRREVSAVLSKCLSNNIRSASSFDTKERLSDFGGSQEDSSDSNSGGQMKMPPCDTSVRYEHRNGGPPKYDVRKCKNSREKKASRRLTKPEKSPNMHGKRCKLKYDEEISDDNESTPSRRDRRLNECRILIPNEIREEDETKREGDNGVFRKKEVGRTPSTDTLTDSLNYLERPGDKCKERLKSTSSPHQELINKFRPRFETFDDKFDIREESEESENSNGKEESTDESKESQDSNFEHRKKFKNFDSGRDKKEDDGTVGSPRENTITVEDSESNHDSEVDDFEKDLQRFRNSYNARVKQNRYGNRGNSDDDENDNSDDIDGDSGSNRKNRRRPNPKIYEHHTKEDGTLDEFSSLAKDENVVTSKGLLKPPPSGVSRVATMETLNPHVSRTHAPCEPLAPLQGPYLFHTT